METNYDFAFFYPAVLGCEGAMDVEISRTGLVPAHSMHVGPELSIRMTSDSSVVKKGFNISVQAVPKGTWITRPSDAKNRINDETVQS